MALYKKKYLAVLGETISNIYQNKRYTPSEINMLHLRFCEYVTDYNENDDIQEILECYYKYIDIVLKYSEIGKFKSRKVYKTNITKYMSSVGDIQWIPAIIKNCMVEVTSVIFEHVTDPSIKVSCAKELIRAYNNILRSCDNSVKEKLVKSGTGIYLYKLADILCNCGDYEYQRFLLETIFRVCPHIFIKSRAAEFFPGTESLQQALMKVDTKYFDASLRIFLNTVNSIFGNVFSFVACDILLDEIYIMPPMDVYGNRQQLWIDFNKTMKTIGIYCEQSCLRTDMISEDDDQAGWELITIFASDVSLVEMKTPHGKKQSMETSVLFKFTLSNSFYVQYPLSEAVTKSKFLKVVINDADVVRELQNRVLPYMFKDKFQNARPRKKSCKAGANPSSGTNIYKVTYKPLDVRVKNYVGSRSVTSGDTRSIKSLDDILNVRNGLNETKSIEISNNDRNCNIDTQYFSAEEDLEEISIQETPKGASREKTQTRRSSNKITVKFPFIRKGVSTRKISLDPFSPILETSEISNAGKAKKLMGRKQNEINQKLGENTASEVGVSSQISVFNTKSSKRYKEGRDEMELGTETTNQPLKITKTYIRTRIPNNINSKKTEENSVHDSSECEIICNDSLGGTMGGTEEVVQEEQLASNKDLIKENCIDVVNIDNNPNEITVINSDDQYFTALPELETSIYEKIQLEELPCLKQQRELLKPSSTISKLNNDEKIQGSQNIETIHVEKPNGINENTASIVNSGTVSVKETIGLENDTGIDVAILCPDAGVSNNVAVRENKVATRIREEIVSSQTGKHIKGPNSPSVTLEHVNSEKNKIRLEEVDENQTLDAEYPSINKHALSLEKPNKENHSSEKGLEENGSILGIRVLRERNRDKKETSSQSDKHSNMSSSSSILSGRLNPQVKDHENTNSFTESENCVNKNHTSSEKLHKQTNCDGKNVKQRNSRFSTTLKSDLPKFTETDDDSTFVDENAIEGDRRQKVNEPSALKITEYEDGTHIQMYEQPKEYPQTVEHHNVTPMANQVSTVQSKNQIIEIIDLTTSDDESEDIRLQNSETNLQLNHSDKLAKPLEYPDSDISSQIISGNNAFAIRKRRKLKSQILKKSQTIPVKDDKNIVTQPETNALDKSMQDKIIENTVENNRVFPDQANSVCLERAHDSTEINDNVYIENQNFLFDEFFRNNEISPKNVEIVIKKQVFDSPKNEATGNKFATKSACKTVSNNKNINNLSLTSLSAQNTQLNHFERILDERSNEKQCDDEYLDGEENVSNSNLISREDDLRKPRDTSEHPVADNEVLHFQKKIEIDNVEGSGSKANEFELKVRMKLVPNTDELQEDTRAPTETLRELRGRTVSTTVLPKTRGRKKKHLAEEEVTARKKEIVRKRSLRNNIQKHSESDKSNRSELESSSLINKIISATEIANDTEDSSELQNIDQDLNNNAKTSKKPLKRKTLVEQSNMCFKNENLKSGQEDEKLEINRIFSDQANSVCLERAYDSTEINDKKSQTIPVKNDKNIVTQPETNALDNPIQDKIIENGIENNLIVPDQANSVSLEGAHDSTEINDNVYIEKQNFLFDDFFRNNEISPKNVEIVIKEQVFDSPKNEATGNKFVTKSACKAVSNNKNINNLSLTSLSSQNTQLNHFERILDERNNEKQCDDEYLDGEENVSNSNLTSGEDDLRKPRDTSEHPVAEDEVLHFQKKIEIDNVEGSGSKANEFELEVRMKLVPNTDGLQKDTRAPTETLRELRGRTVSTTVLPKTRGRKKKHLAEEEVTARKKEIVRKRSLRKNIQKHSESDKSNRSELESSSLINKIISATEIANDTEDSSELQNIDQDLNNNAKTSKKSLKRKTLVEQSNMSFKNENLKSGQEDEKLEQTIKQNNSISSSADKKKIALSKIYGSNNECKITKLPKLKRKNNCEEMLKQVDTDNRVSENKDFNALDNEALEILNSIGEETEENNAMLNNTKLSKNGTNEMDAVQKLDNSKQIDEDFKWLTNPLFDVTTEKVISQSRIGQSSDGKRKLSQSDTTLCVPPCKAKRYKLYDPNDLTHLEIDQHSSVPVSPRNERRPNGKTGRISEEGRRPSKKKEKKQRSSESMSREAMSFQKSVTSSKKKNNKRRAAANDFDLTRINERQKVLFHTFLSSFVDDSNKSKMKLNRKRKVKTVRRTRIDSLSDFERNSEHELEIQPPSKIKILENIVLQSASDALSRKNEALKKTTSELTSNLEKCNDTIEEAYSEQAWRATLRIFHTMENEMLGLLVKYAPRHLRDSPEYKTLLRKQQNN